MSDRFHSKYHRFNHHSSTQPLNPDAGLDPLGSFNYPFQGDFNLLGSLSSRSLNSSSLLQSKGVVLRVETTEEDSNHSLISNGMLVLSGDVYVDGRVYGPLITGNNSDTNYNFSEVFKEKIDFNLITGVFDSIVSINVDQFTLSLNDSGKLSVSPALQKEILKFENFNNGFDVDSYTDDSEENVKNVGLKTGLYGIYLNSNDQLSADLLYIASSGLSASSVTNSLCLYIKESDFLLVNNKLQFKPSFTEGIIISSNTPKLRIGSGLVVKDNALQYSYTFSKGISSIGTKVGVHANRENFYLANNKLSIFNVLNLSNNPSQTVTSGEVNFNGGISVEEGFIIGDLPPITSTPNNWPKLIAEPSHEMGGMVVGTADNRIIAFGNENQFFVNGLDFLTRYRESPQISPDMKSLLKTYIGAKISTTPHPYTRSIVFDRQIPVPAIVPFKDNYNFKNNSRFKQIKYTPWGITVLFLDGTVWTSGIGACSSLKKPSDKNFAAPQYVFEQIIFPDNVRIRKIDVTSSISLVHPESAGTFLKNLPVNHLDIFAQKFVAIDENDNLHFWGRNFIEKNNLPKEITNLKKGAMGSRIPKSHNVFGDLYSKGVTDVKLFTSVHFLKEMDTTSFSWKGDKFVYRTGVGELVLIIKDNNLYSYGNLVGDANFADFNNGEQEFCGPNFMPLVTLGRPLVELPHEELEKLAVKGLKPNQFFNKAKTGWSSPKIDACVELKNGAFLFGSNLTSNSFIPVANVHKFVDSGNNNTNLIGIIKTDGSVWIAGNLFHSASNSNTTSKTNVYFSYFANIALLPPVKSAVISTVYNSFKVFDYVSSLNYKTASLAFYKNGISPYCNQQTYLMAAISESNEAWLWFLGRKASNSYFQSPPVKLNIPPVKQIAHTSLDIADTRPYENVAFLTESGDVYITKFKAPESDADDYLNPKEYDVTNLVSINKDLANEAKFVPLPVKGIRNIQYITTSWAHLDPYSVLNGSVLGRSSPIIIETVPQTKKILSHYEYYIEISSQPELSLGGVSRILDNHSVGPFSTFEEAQVAITPTRDVYGWTYAFGLNINGIRMSVGSWLYPWLRENGNSMPYWVDETDKAVVSKVRKILKQVVNRQITDEPGVIQKLFDVKVVSVPIYKDVPAEAQPVTLPVWLIVYTGGNLSDTHSANLARGILNNPDIPNSNTWLWTQPDRYDDIIDVGKLKYNVVSELFYSKEEARDFVSKNKKRLLREVSRVDISCPKLVIQETYVSVYINSDKQTTTTEVIKPPPFSVDVDTFHGPKPDREYIHGLLMESKAGEMLFYSYLTHKFINYSKFFS
jgi:hypothetical protein